MGVSSDGEGRWDLPVAGTAKGWSCLMRPSALQGLTGFRAFPAGASSQPLELMSSPPNFLHPGPPAPRVGGDLPLPTPHSTSSLRFWLPLFSQQAPPPTWGLCGAPRARAWLHSRPTCQALVAGFFHRLLGSPWARSLPSATECSERLVVTLPLQL